MKRALTTLLSAVVLFGWLAAPGHGIGTQQSNAAAGNGASAAQQSQIDFGSCSNSFGVSLLSELRKTNKNGNVVVSPVSVSVALCMLLNGADAQTLTQTAKLLGVDAKDLVNLNKSVSDFLDDTIQADPDVELEIANAIFAATGSKVDAQFMRTVQKEFQARVKVGSLFRTPPTIYTCKACEQLCVSLR